MTLGSPLRSQAKRHSAKFKMKYLPQSAPRGLRLGSVTNSFDLLVGVPLDEVPELLRV